MIFNDKSDKSIKNIEVWHSWFAWYPVTLGMFNKKTYKVYEELGTAWLMRVERRYTGWLTGRDGERIFEYREIGGSNGSI